MKMIEKKERVKVLYKEQPEPFSRTSGIRNEITFERPDGSNIMIDAPSEIFGTTIVNDTGSLTYKEQGNEGAFIGFESDHCVCEPEKKTKRQCLSSCLMFLVFTCIIPIVLAVGVIFYYRATSNLPVLIVLYSLSFLSPVGFFITRDLIVKDRWNRAAEKKEQVTVLEYRYYIPEGEPRKRHVCVFELSDGKRKIVIIPKKKAEVVGVAKATGVLAYKELEGCVRFIEFKKDE